MEANLEQKDNKEKSDDLYRITMTREAEKALCDLLDKANTGFIGGKINRTQLVSWVLIKMNQEVNDTYLQELRAVHFDDVFALEQLYRKAKDSGQISKDLKAILMREMGFVTPLKRPTKNKVDR